MDNEIFREYQELSDEHRQLEAKVLQFLFDLRNKYFPLTGDKNSDIKALEIQEAYQKHFDIKVAREGKITEEDLKPRI